MRIKSFAVCHILAFQSHIECSSSREFNYCYFISSLIHCLYVFIWMCVCVWVCVCACSMLWSLVLRLSTQHSDMWLNYINSNRFFSFLLYHLRWIHNPPTEIEQNGCLYSSIRHYLLTVDDHLNMLYICQSKIALCLRASFIRHTTAQQKQNKK